MCHVERLIANDIQGMNFTYQMREYTFFFFFFSSIIGFKDKLSLACTQQVSSYIKGEDLLSSSIALCGHKQERKETWSRQMDYHNIR